MTDDKLVFMVPEDECGHTRTLDGDRGVAPVDVFGSVGNRRSVDDHGPRSPCVAEVLSTDVNFTTGSAFVVEIDGCDDRCARYRYFRIQLRLC